MQTRESKHGFFFEKKVAQRFVYNEFIIYLCIVKIKKGGVTNEMSRKERLINQIFRLLALIETPANQSIIRQIEGLLNALKEEK